MCNENVSQSGLLHLAGKKVEQLSVDASYAQRMGEGGGGGRNVLFVRKYCLY